MLWSYEHVSSILSTNCQLSPKHSGPSAHAPCIQAVYNVMGKLKYKGITPFEIKYPSMVHSWASGFNL